MLWGMPQSISTIFNQYVLSFVTGLCGPAPAEAPSNQGDSTGVTGYSAQFELPSVSRISGEGMQSNIIYKKSIKSCYENGKNLGSDIIDIFQALAENSSNAATLASTTRTSPTPPSTISIPPSYSDSPHSSAVIGDILVEDRRPPSFRTSASVTLPSYVSRRSTSVASLEFTPNPLFAGDSSADETIQC